MSVTLQHQPAPYSRLLKRFALVAFILGGLGELLILVAAFRSDFHLGFSVYVSAGALAVFMLLLFLIFHFANPPNKPSDPYGPGGSGPNGPDGPRRFLAWVFACLTAAGGIFSFTSFFFGWPQLIEAHEKIEQARLDQLVESAKEACLIGTQFDFYADANGNIGFENSSSSNSQGKTRVNVRKSKGAAAVFAEDLRIVADEQIRTCMKPYVDKIFSAILDQ